MSLSPKSSHLPSARRKFSRKRTSAREWQLTQPRNSPTCTDVSKLPWLGALSLHWCPTNLAVNSVQLLISRQTGQVRPSTHMDGNRVYQELWQIKTALTLLGLFPFWLSRRECRERSMTLPFGA